MKEKIRTCIAEELEEEIRKNVRHKIKWDKSIYSAEILQDTWLKMKRVILIIH